LDSHLPWQRVALLYPGDRAMRDRSDPTESRFAALFAALRDAGIDAVPAVYNDDFADEVEAQLRRAALVLAWCNPIEGGRRRDKLDALLRRLADLGVVVSAHPDAILALGTKDILLATRGLPFGSDVHRIGSLAQLEAELPARLREGPRVLKQHRGHSGIGVWKIEREGERLRVRAAQRGSDEEWTDLASLLARMAPYFEPSNGGHLVDQAWQPGIVDGMLRAYLVGDRVAGFGHQALNALVPAPRQGERAPPPGPRLYHPAEWAPGQALRSHLESGWVDLLREAVHLPRERLPLLWDCDFIPARGTGGQEGWVLCEINVSSVAPFPPSAVPMLVDAVRLRLPGGS